VRELRGDPIAVGEAQNVQQVQAEVVLFPILSEGSLEVQGHKKECTELSEEQAGPFTFDPDTFRTVKEDIERDGYLNFSGFKVLILFAACCRRKSAELRMGFSQNHGRKI